MNNDDLFYKASGSFNPLIIAAIPFIAVAVFILASIYSLIIIYNPFVYINFLLFFGFCFALGTITNYTIKLFKVRNPKISMLFSLLTGCMTIYIAWATFISFLFSKSGQSLGLMETMLHPAMLWTHINGLAVIGWYSFGSVDVNGVLSWITWSIEAVGFVGTPFVFAFSFATTSVFCERCNCWAEEEEGIIYLNHPKPEELAEKFLQQDLSFIDQAIPVQENDGGFFQVDSECCKTCDDTLTLSLRVVTRELNDENEIEENSDTIYEDLIVSKSTLEKVLNYREKFGSNTNSSSALKEESNFASKEEPA